MKSKIILLTTLIYFPSILMAQSAYFGGKGDGHAMASTGSVMVGIDENRLKQEGVMVMPNPVTTSQSLKVEIPKYSGKLQYQLINEMGRIIRRGQLASSQKSHKISIVGLPSGLYVLSLVKGTNRLNKKIVVVKGE